MYDTSEDPKVVKAKYFIRGEFLVGFFILIFELFFTIFNPIVAVKIETNRYRNFSNIVFLSFSVFSLIDVR